MFKLGDRAKVVKDVMSQETGEVSQTLGKIGTVAALRESPDSIEAYDVYLILDDPDGVDTDDPDNNLCGFFENELELQDTEITMATPELAVGMMVRLQDYDDAGVPVNQPPEKRDWGVVTEIDLPLVQIRRRGFGTKIWFFVSDLTVLPLDQTSKCRCGVPGCQGHQTSGNGSYYEDMTPEDLNCD